MLFRSRLAGPVFRLEKANAMFANIHTCFQLPQFMQRVWAWALAEGYVEVRRLHHLEYVDDETGQALLFSFLSENAMQLCPQR